MPAAAVANRTPAIAGMAGVVFGARGEMVVDMVLFRHPEARAQRASKGYGPGRASFEARAARGHLRMTVKARCWLDYYFFAGAAGLSVAGSGAGAGLSRRSIFADLRKLSTSSAWARWAT